MSRPKNSLQFEQLILNVIYFSLVVLNTIYKF